MPIHRTCRFRVSTAGLIEQVQAQRTVHVDKGVQASSAHCEWSPPVEELSAKEAEQMVLQRQDSGQFLEEAAEKTTPEKEAPVEKGAELV